MDMAINLQRLREKGLAGSSRVILTKFQGMDYTISLECMTQVSLKTGAIRPIRRRVLSELPWVKKESGIHCQSHPMNISCL